MVQQTKGIFDGLNIKPDIQTFLESETDGPEYDGGNPKTPGGGCQVVLRSEPLHHKSASDDGKCVTALYRFVPWVP